MDPAGDAPQSLPPRAFLEPSGRAQYTARQYCDAIEALSRLTRPDSRSTRSSRPRYAQMGEAEHATAHAAGGACGRSRRFRSSACLSTLHYRLDTNRNHLREGLLKAGLPE